MKKNIFLLVFTILVNKSLATEQIPDYFIIDGIKNTILFNYPLEEFFKKYPKKRPENKIGSTALYRGYVATFELKGDEIYIVDVKIEKKEEKDGKIIYEWISVFNDVFENSKQIKADWINGLMVTENGMNLFLYNKNYQHNYKYYSVSEFYNVLELKNGKLEKFRKFNYREYEVFKERQYQAFVKTNSYEKLKRERKLKYADNNDNNDFLFKQGFYRYHNKILDDTVIKIEIPKIINEKFIGFWTRNQKKSSPNIESKNGFIKRYADGTFEKEYDIVYDNRDTRHIKEIGQWWTEDNIYYEYSDYISYARNYEFEIVNENEIRIRYFHDEPNFEKENCLFIDNLK